jgi:hypothetical protein
MTLYSDIEYLKAAIDGLKQLPGMADDETLRADMLEGSTDIEKVFTAILAAIREDEITMAGIDAITKDLDARKTRAQNRTERKRDLLRNLMERANLSKFTLPEATLSLSWRAPAPIVLDEAVLPYDCTKVIRKPDMTIIKERLDKGEMLPGVALSNGIFVLTIRVK